MPPKPIAPASSVSHTCGAREAPQLAAAGGLGGRRATTARTASTSSDREQRRGRPPPRRPTRQPRLLSQPGGRRHAEHVRDGQPEHHQRDGAALAALGRARRRRPARRRRSRRRAGSPSQEPGQHEHPVATPASALSRVADGVRDHQGDQQAAARQPGAEEGQHRGADRPRPGRTPRSCGRPSGSRRRRRRRSAAAGPWPRTRWCRWRSRPSRAPAPPGVKWRVVAAPGEAAGRSSSSRGQSCQPAATSRLFRVPLLTPGPTCRRSAAGDGQRLVERRRGAHHRGGLLVVGAVVAADVGRRGPARRSARR